VISHMPLLGYLVSELVAGVEPPLFATSGITLIDKHAEQACIVWQHAPHSIS
ncbi:MAG: phosphohistidine phosphatase SixA, partial [Shewanella xiamenensis]|nr:phosphohistidine phosphatase SixA [Shewanella xiamenensis]